MPATKQKETNAKPAQAAGGDVTITQVGSPIGRHSSQRATLVGLGLTGRHQTKTLKSTPEVQGMINKVKHLLKVEV